MALYRLLIAPIALTALAFLMGCTGLSRPPEHLVRNPNGTYSGPGSPKWWNENKSRAEFVVGEGFRVHGVPGFFDDNGRPISDPVAPIGHDESKKDSLLGSVVPEEAYSKFKTAIGQGPNADAARDMFTEAHKLYGQKKYVSAAKMFQKAADRWPGSDLQEEAMFMVGEGYFFADKYDDANDAYEAFVKKYSGSKFLDTAISRQWMIARYWQQTAEQDPEWPTTPNLFDKTRPRFDTHGRALKIYDNIRMNDPTGPWSDEALMATATSHFSRGRYEDADYHFGILRREYPKSEHQLMAHLLGLQCKIRKYQGPEYDPAPLEEAEQLIKQLKLQFGAQLDEEDRQRVDVIAAQIAHHRALRDWHMAQYYDKSDHFGAARFYYARVANNFPSTKMGQSAQDRLAEISGRPDSPPERLSWLIEMFPEDRERTEMNIKTADQSVLR
ncbi:MAG: outer membrane protein assembly factor BamD [Pirellulales bacterium]|nr:outer membrane protein assembly factor BamD [Pirellulales bacterium]